MSVTNPDDVVTKGVLADFYQEILPYLGGGGGSGHTGTIYGFIIDGYESNPDSCVQYISDAIGMTPAHMDYTNDVFDYGSWGNAFFMPKPCMLKYDGTVDYYLDPNDYTKKEDGTASDIANTSYAGNAMMEWGQNGKKIWLKIEPGYNENSVAIYVADYKADVNFHDYSFHDINGASGDHFYTSIYNSSSISSKFRSLSGQQVSSGNTTTQERTLAQANNQTSNNLWDIEVYSDVLLINVLLILISKSLNAQSKFGQGLTVDGTESINNSFRTGVHNTKGLFYGTNSGTASTYTNAVKVFGIENWWGFQWRRCLGYIMASGVQKCKLTYNIEDGSSSSGYNVNGEGYKTENSTPISYEGQYISNAYIKYMKYTYDGMYPSSINGTNSTYYCDGINLNNTETMLSAYGGNSLDGTYSGPFRLNLGLLPTVTAWTIGARLSCKPLAQTS